MRRKDGEPKFIVPWEKSYNHILGDDRIQNVKSNIDWLQSNPDIFEDFVLDKKEAEYEKLQELDIDSSIYEKGIFSEEEKSTIHLFHSSSIEHKKDLLRDLEKTRIQELGMRILFRNYPEFINEDIKSSTMLSMIQPGSINIRGQIRRTPQDAIDEANSIMQKEEIDDEQRRIISSYISFLQSYKA